MANAGSFKDGNPGGPGRPKRATEAAYVMALVEACPVDTWRAICDRAVDDAKGGDAKAREWVGRYLCGIPKVMSEPLAVAAMTTEGMSSMDRMLARLSD